MACFGSCGRGLVVCESNETSIDAAWLTDLVAPIIIIDVLQRISRVRHRVGEKRSFRKRSCRPAEGLSHRSKGLTWWGSGPIGVWVVGSTVQKGGGAHGSIAGFCEGGPSFAKKTSESERGAVNIRCRAEPQESKDHAACFLVFLGFSAFSSTSASSCHLLLSTGIIYSTSGHASSAFALAALALAGACGQLRRPTPRTGLNAHSTCGGGCFPPFRPTKSAAHLDCASWAPSPRSSAPNALWLATRPAWRLLVGCRSPFRASCRAASPLWSGSRRARFLFGFDLKNGSMVDCD